MLLQQSISLPDLVVTGEKIAPDIIRTIRVFRDDTLKFNSALIINTASYNIEINQRSLRHINANHNISSDCLLTVLTSPDYIVSCKDHNGYTATAFVKFYNHHYFVAITRKGFLVTAYLLPTYKFSSWLSHTEIIALQSASGKRYQTRVAGLASFKISITMRIAMRILNLFTKIFIHKS
ncbi:hypothetical protein [Secundilactobacillus similis]|nr:hypothetical protein [Secundilactobacillus similis]